MVVKIEKRGQTGQTATRSSGLCEHDELQNSCELCAAAFTWYFQFPNTPFCLIRPIPLARNNASLLSVALH